MKLTIKIFLLIILALVAVAPLVAGAQAKSGFSIVFCGGPGQSPCTFDDLTKALVRLVNFLFACAAIVAAFHIVNAGWKMMAGQGNPEKVTEAKLALTHAVMGFALVLVSFAVVNLVLGIMGIECEWWRGPYGGVDSSLKCLY